MKAKHLPEYRIRIERAQGVAEGLGDVFRTSAQIAALARTLIGDDEREHFAALFLDARNRLKGWQEISVGTLTASLVHPREAYRAAIGIGASAVVFFHNHPSGDPAPSRDDRELTKRLWDAGVILGIRVLDHVIVGDGSSQHWSFADEGELPSC